MYEFLGRSPFVNRKLTMQLDVLGAKRNRQ